MSFTALGNYQRGYISRILGRGGIESTAKRISKMLEHKDEQFYPESSITYIKYVAEIWKLADGAKVNKENKELIKRLLQEIEKWTWNSLDDKRQSELTEEFEKDL